MDSSNEKLSNKDLNQSEEVPFMQKIFMFFYTTLQMKAMNKFFYCLFMVLEAIQLNSYVFDKKHYETWALSDDTIELLHVIAGALRIAPLMKYVSFTVYVIVWAIVLGLVFINCILIIMVIQFNKIHSKVYSAVAQAMRVYADILLIFLFIPFAELMALMLHCEEKKVALVTDGITCFSGFHYLYAVISIIFLICFTALALFFATFMFYPFNHDKENLKLDATAEIMMCLFKLVTVLQFVFISNEWLSIGLLLIVSIFNIKMSNDNPAYCGYILQCCVSIRNATFCWAYIVLLVAKISKGFVFNGEIYLLAFGYPLIVIVSILKYRKQFSDYTLSMSTCTVPSDFIFKLKSLIKLVDSYLMSKGNKGNKNSKEHKEEILLRGYIMIHIENCVFKECPLEKFVDPSSSFAVQKTCLLHHMNNTFLIGVKNFPQNRMITMYYIAFNFEKKYNLNAVKTYLAKLEKGNNTLLEEYILFYLKQSYSINNKGNAAPLKNRDDEDIENQDQTKENFARLKYLIEASTKLYGEFWGILSTHMTANLNLQKLFGVGNRLNIFLKEINRLWDTELKAKRIDIENQGVIQLYAYFLREIMRNKKKADEITKKLNEKQQNESKKVENENWETNNLYSILENQDYIIFARSNEKGECHIFQCSNSIVHLLGYVKQDFIGKSIEIMLPSIFTVAHSKMLSQRVKQNQSKVVSTGIFSSNENKKQNFILPKTKVGYLLALNARFTLYNDDDFSHTYIIKSKFEYRDTKANYCSYILTNDEFDVDSISSSALNLGLSLDLLKKYVVSLNILIRDATNERELNFSQIYKDFEDEPKAVTWVFPHIIYPKNDSQRQKDEDILKLIQQSQTKVFLLQIFPLKFYKDETAGYCFRFAETENLAIIRKSWDDSKEIKTLPSKTIMFDLLRLSFIRTEVVHCNNDKEDYFQFNTAPIEQEEQITLIEKRNSKGKSSKREHKNNKSSDEENDSPKEEAKVNQLTKDKLNEYQAKNANETKQFIFTLPFFGDDIFIERHRSNKERYSVGKITEPHIKIIISEFLKRMGQKKKDFKKELTKRQSGVASIKTPTTNVSASSQEQSYLQGKLSTDSRAYLSSIFNDKSVTYIKILSFIVFLLVAAIMSLEFGLSFCLMNVLMERMGYVNKAYEIISAMMYAKFYVLEIIKAQNSGYFHTEGKTNEQYIKDMMVELNEYRKIIFDNYNSFQNSSVDFSQEYYDFTTKEVAYIRTLVNNVPTVEFHSFAATMSRIPTNIFYVSTVTDNYKSVTMENRNAYELVWNLLNDYFSLWARATLLISADATNKTKPASSAVLIYGFSFLISVLSLVLLWLLILVFIRDREKPVNLFLTIKKAQFIDLKTSSEIFLNKLLNKFFGNEEAEEESITDYSPQSKTDIIISAFKQKNEMKCASKMTSEYLFNYIKMVVFFVVFEAYMSFKFFYIKDARSNINQYAEVLNVTHFGQADMVLGLNVFKSYFFDKSIPIFNKTDTEAEFHKKFVKLTEAYGNFIYKTYNTTCFLERNYLAQFYENLNKDISAVVIDKEFQMKPYFKDGFNLVTLQFFESLRFLLLNYLEFKDMAFVTQISIVSQMNYIIKYVVRPWFVHILNLLNSSFTAYCDEVKLIQITVFIILLVLTTLLYCLVWKSYEEKLKVILKTSVDLINLIPEEIKDSIVECLNKEEEEKKDS